MTVFLDLDDVLHVVKRLGFSIRDPGLLSAALSRPATIVAGIEAYPSLEGKAAALFESLARNHPLIDGNKRTAWIVTMLFLWINGYRHVFDTDTAFDLVLEIAQGRLRQDEVAAVLAANIVPHDHTGETD